MKKKMLHCEKPTPTEGQLKKLKKLKTNFPKDLTRLEAQHIISENEKRN